jgi:hypothetical protein
MMYNANGRRLRVSSDNSPIRCMKYCLGACTNLGRCNPCRLANRCKISELFPFIVTGPPVIHSSSLPLSLRFKMALRARGSYRHPARLDTVSTRRLGVWLALTQAGFPPACQSTISSPQVQRFVRPFIQVQRWICAAHQSNRRAGVHTADREYSLRVRSFLDIPVVHQYSVKHHAKQSL